MTFYFNSEESFRHGITRWLLRHAYHLTNSYAVIEVRAYRTRYSQERQRIAIAKIITPDDIAELCTRVITLGMNPVQIIISTETSVVAEAFRRI